MQTNDFIVTTPQSFWNILERAPLPTDHVIELGLRIASALEEQSGGVGNLTPEMLSFDLEKAHITRDDFVTPTLLAPEALRENGVLADAKDRQLADVWSLGIILYMFLAGHSPFGGVTHRQQVHAITAHKPTPDIRNVRPDVRGDLAGMLYHMLQRNPERRGNIPDIETVRRTLVSIKHNHETPYSIPEFPIIEGRAILKDAYQRFQEGKGALSESEYLFVRRLVDEGELNIDQTYTALWRRSKLLAFGRRLAARWAFSYLLGLSVPVFVTVFDVLFSPSKNLSTLVEQAVTALILVVILNSFSIGIITISSHLSKGTQPSWWALPAAMGPLAGLVLVAVRLLGFTTSYEGAPDAFLVGVIAGLALGGVYTLSMPAERQDTILKQSRRSIIICSIVGILYGIYFLVTQFNASMAFYNVAVSIFGIPLICVGLLLSFVLGVEMGDRYVER